MYAIVNINGIQTKVEPEAVIEVRIHRRDGFVELCLTPGFAGDEDSLGLWIAARLAETLGGGVAPEPGGLRAWLGSPSAGRTPR